MFYISIEYLDFVFQDLIIFPDDCEFKRVNQCTTGRVYVLKFKAGSKRLFFWMQVSERLLMLASRAHMQHFRFALSEYNEMMREL